MNTNSKKNISHIADKELWSKIQKIKNKNVWEAYGNNLIPSKFFTPSNFIWTNDMDILLIRANYKQNHHKCSIYLASRKT